MTDGDIREIISAERMVAVMTANNNVFKDNVRAMSLKTALIDDVALMNASGASAISAMGLQKDGTQDKNAALTTLEKFIRKIAANGKVIKKDDPTFDNTFKIPRGSFNNQALLETAQAFIDNLTPAAVAKFSEYGYNSVTPTNLQAKIDAVFAGGTQQNEGRTGGVAATANEKATIKRLRANRRLLKAIGENITEEKGDAGLIAEWKSACKIEKNKPSTPPPAPPNS